MRAAIYARISSDQEGTALGVTRQLQDCRKLADELSEAIDQGPQTVLGHIGNGLVLQAALAK